MPDNNNNQPTDEKDSSSRSHYGDANLEADCLRHSVGLLDLDHRDRICLLGEDRIRFLNGQVTNNIRDLGTGEGCYALTVSNKGHIEGDANVYRLADEVLLDLEPGYGADLRQRLDRFIISDDVELIDVSEPFAHLSVQGPKSCEALRATTFGKETELPSKPKAILLANQEEDREVYIARNPRTGSDGFDLFVARAYLITATQELTEAVESLRGSRCGTSSLETLRVEAGVPRFPNDMTPSVLAPEIGNTDRTISYTKGCYIGQEVINRIKSIGKVNRQLRGFQVLDRVEAPQLVGAQMIQTEKVIGFVTSAVLSQPHETCIGLGLVKTATLDVDKTIELQMTEGNGTVRARIRTLPFTLEDSSRAD